MIPVLDSLYYQSWQIELHGYLIQIISSNLLPNNTEARRERQLVLITILILTIYIKNFLASRYSMHSIKYFTITNKEHNNMRYYREGWHHITLLWL